jgi:hypothetical protein
MLAAAGCSDSDPVIPTTPSALQPLSVTAEPLTVRPEFVSGAFCATHPPFRGNLIVVVGGRQDVIIRGVHFRFHHRRGGHTFPVVTPTPTASGTIVTTPTYGPVPTPGFATLPGASPIPIPGSPPIEGVLNHANTFRRLPFTFELGCGVPADGTMVIRVDTADRGGTFYAREAKVEVEPRRDD